MNNLPRSTILALSLFGFPSLVPGCAPSLTLAGAQVHEAPPEAVSQCTFLGTVVGNARYGPMTDVLNRAGEKGATHIVWLSVSGGRGATALARAYRCSSG
jgi:hypothetical protein